MRSRIYLTVVFSLLFPIIAAAQASFPSQSVWLSDTSPTVGDKVRIYAVVYNGSDAAVSGALTFLVDGKTQEVKNLTLDPGESVVSSTLWTAGEGEHSFSATFGKEGAAASVSASIAATVEAPPTAVEQTLTEAKAVGSQIASTSLPIVSSVASKVFETTEKLRNAGIAYLESAQSDAPEDEAAVSAVLGTTTVNQVEGFKSEAPAKSSFGGYINKASQMASVGLLAIFRSLWLFYPILVGLLLLIFRWLYRWATGPRI